MKPELTRKLIGAASTLMGLWWIYEMVFPLIGSFWGRDALIPLVASPGVLLIYFGIRLFRKMSESSLKWVLGPFFVFFAFSLAARLAEVFPTLLPGNLLHSTLLFVSSIVVIPVHLLVVRLLLRHLTGQVRSSASLLSRGVVLLMAWQFWLLLSAFCMEYFPAKEGTAYALEEPWEIVSLVLPIIVACGLYRGVIAMLNKAQVAEQVVSYESSAT